MSIIIYKKLYESYVSILQKPEQGYILINESY